MIRHEDGSVTLTKEEYAEIMSQLDWLDALEAAGVDNWDGYDDAVDILNSEED